MKSQNKKNEFDFFSNKKDHPFYLLIFLPPPSHSLLFRIPLKKVKSLRQSLKEHGLLEKFLEKHPYNLGSKYFPSQANANAAEPLENYMDVSILHRRMWLKKYASVLNIMRFSGCGLGGFSNAPCWPIIAHSLL